MEQKKSIQLNQAFGAILTLVLVAVLIIVAIFIFAQLATSFAGQQTSSITNESVLTEDDSVTLVFAAGTCGFTTWTPGLVLNRTDNIGIDNATLVEGVDYSIQSAAGTITNLTATWNDSFITYTYDWGSTACNASEDMTVEFSNYTSLVGLVGTIIFLGLVIGVLVTAFAFGGRREV